ncbi:593_t:CDS:2, partial [Gigaspora margarita]
VTIAIDPINDLSFKYQSNNIHEFMTIIRKRNPQNILSICEKDHIVTIYNKESLNFYCMQLLDVKNVKVTNRRNINIKKNHIGLTQEKINELTFNYLEKAVKASADSKNFFNDAFMKIKDDQTENFEKYFHENMIFNDETHIMIAKTIRKFFDGAFKNTCKCERQWFFRVVKANLGESNNPFQRAKVGHKADIKGILKNTSCKLEALYGEVSVGLGPFGLLIAGREKKVS